MSFSLKAKFEAELTCLVESEVIYPVESSDWGTPILPVIKSNGSVRICGDLTVFLNKFGN